MLFIFLSPHFCSAFCRSLLRGWDFHMVCCCIKSNLTLLDQRLWGSGVCALCAPSPPPSFYFFSSFGVEVGSLKLVCLFACIPKCLPFSTKIYGTLSKAALLGLLLMCALTGHLWCSMSSCHFQFEAITEKLSNQFSLSISIRQKDQTSLNELSSTFTSGKLLSRQPSPLNKF